MKPRWKYAPEHSPLSGMKKKVTIEGKQLSFLPPEVFELEALTALEMSPQRESCLAFRMDHVPKEIGQLRCLTLLYMDSNDLNEIPPEIGHLVNLQRLALSNNCLTSLPPELARLQHLRSLHLANNNFQFLPAQVCELKNLTFLDASDNEIEAVPASIKNLKKLETLLLLFNCLENLPEGFCRLRNIRTLWLGNNRLRRLPVRFGNLVKLDWGHSRCSCNFEGNPLQCPPEEVCSQGPLKIKEYFDSWLDVTSIVID